MKLTIYLSALLVFATFSMGCSKDDKGDPVVPEETNTDRISSADWKFSKAETAGVNISSQIPICYLDNVLTFSDNGTGSVSEGFAVCAPSTAGAFTWSFNTDETTLTTNAVLVPGGTTSFTVNSVTDDQLVLSQPVTIPPSPVPFTVTVTFVHP